MASIEIRYDELRVGDIIRWHGAKERVTEVVDECESDHYAGERVILFTLEPYDDEAVNLLGKFYSKGTYGGVGFLTVTLIERPVEPEPLFTKTDILEYAKAQSNEAAADLLLLCGPDGYDGSYTEYEELMNELR